MTSSSTNSVRAWLNANDLNDAKLMCVIGALAFKLHRGRLEMKVIPARTVKSKNR